MKTHRLFLALVSWGLAACQELPQPSSFSVHGGFLRDSLGRIVVLRGVNLSTEHKKPPYVGWHKAADFQKLSGWGFHSVRFLISWAALAPKPGVFDDNYLNEVEIRLNWAREAGLSVVLDMHQDVFGEGFGHNGAPRWACDEAKYAEHKKLEPWFLQYASPPVRDCFDRLWTDPALISAFVSAWRRVAERFASRPEVLGFDILNEPSPGNADLRDFEADLLLPFYLRVIDEVRQAAPHWVAFVEPSNTRNLGIPTKLPTLDRANVVYAPHSYDALAEQGKGFDPAHRAALLMNVSELADEARRMNAALWIGEYGGNEQHPGITEYMDAQYDAAALAGAGSMYWDGSRGPGYGLFENDGTEKTKLFSALVRPYPRYVSGNALSFSFDENTSCMTTTYEPTGTAPTVLFVPKTVYPNGYFVCCTDCQYEKGETELTVLAPPNSTPTSITICKKACANPSE